VKGNGSCKKSKMNNNNKSAFNEEMEQYRIMD
ncbi:MAG: hypothetical protein ACI8RD_005689, partial [Bacillariaceae sp.]